MSLRSTFTSASSRPWIGDSTNGIIRGPTGLGFGDKVALGWSSTNNSDPVRVVIGTSVSSPYKNIYIFSKYISLNSWKFETQLVPTGTYTSQWGSAFQIASGFFPGLVIVGDPGASTIFKYYAGTSVRSRPISSWPQVDSYNFSTTPNMGAVISPDFSMGLPSSYVNYIGSSSSTNVSIFYVDTMYNEQFLTAPNTFSKIVGGATNSHYAGVNATPSNTIYVWRNPGLGAGPAYTITVPSASPATTIAMSSGSDNLNPRIFIGVPGHNGNTGVCYLYQGTTLVQTITSPSPFAGERFGENIDLNNDYENYGLLIVGTGQNKTTTGGKVHMYRGDLTASLPVYDGSFTNPITTTVGNATQYFGKAVSSIRSDMNQVAVGDPVNSVVYCLRKLDGTWTLSHA